MAELTPRERLQPSLLDRLIDDEPEKNQESREQRVLSIRQLRECVRRDLSWLFNATNLATARNLAAYPLTAHSVLNYGLPELSGHSLSNFDVARLEQQLKQIIIDFEPRILPHSIAVRLYVDEQRMDNNALAFEIEGELWAQPVPQQLYLKTEIDLELGDVNIIDYSTH